MNNSYQILTRFHPVSSYPANSAMAIGVRGPFIAVLAVDECIETQNSANDASIMLTGVGSVKSLSDHVNVPLITKSELSFMNSCHIPLW